jgi:hypothetical protein
MYETEPVFNRHKETTHTHENVEASKHNEIAALSHESTTKDESLIEENLLQQLRELIEHLLCGGDRLDGDIVLEIDSIEKTLKILPQQSSLVRGELEGNYFNFFLINSHSFLPFRSSFAYSNVLYIRVHFFFSTFFPFPFFLDEKNNVYKREKFERSAIDLKNINERDLAENGLSVSGTVFAVLAPEIFKILISSTLH